MLTIQKIGMDPISMYIKKILGIISGGMLMIGNCCASDQVTTDQGFEWLSRWTSIEDVNHFIDYVEQQRNSGNTLDTVKPKINYEVIDNTMKANWNDLLTVLCILTNAHYSVDIDTLDLKISAALDTLITKISILFKNENKNENFSSPELYSTKWAWLLFCSQTVDGKGEELKDSYNLYPICIAKELLEKETNGFQNESMSASVLEHINKICEQ